MRILYQTHDVTCTWDEDRDEMLAKRSRDAEPSEWIPFDIEPTLVRGVVSVMREQWDEEAERWVERVGQVTVQLKLLEASRRPYYTMEERMARSWPTTTELSDTLFFAICHGMIKLRELGYARPRVPETAREGLRLAAAELRYEAKTNYDEDTEGYKALMDMVRWFENPVFFPRCTEPQ